MIIALTRVRAKSIRLPAASSLTQSEYEASVNRMLERGTVVGKLSQLDLPLSPGEGGAGCASPTIVYYAAGLSDPGTFLSQSQSRGLNVVVTIAGP